MFDRLFDFLAQVWQYLIPCVVVDQYERAVVLRWGKYHRTLEPGFHLRWPIGEAVFSANVVANTSNLGAQSLTTSDGKAAVVSAIVTWKVNDIQKFLLEVEGQTEAVMDLAYGAIAEWVLAHPWDEICRKDASERITRLVRRRSAEYGIEIVRVQLSDVAQCRSVRLWNAGS